MCDTSELFAASLNGEFEIMAIVGKRATPYARRLAISSSIPHCSALLDELVTRNRSVLIPLNKTNKFSSTLAMHAGCTASVFCKV